jgi:REP element-mobilizing transposase RayT
MNEHNLDFAIHTRQNSVMPRKQKIRWPRRPPRLSRLFDNAPPLYFVTFNCYKRRHLLAHPEVHEAFRTFCFKAQEHAIAVGRYVIMPEHIHLFVAFPRVGITLPGWVGSLRNVIGKRLLKLGISKPHWQEGFFDHLLRGRESYSQKWNYVRMNPVRAKLCETPETWSYQGEIVWLPFD